MKARWIVGAFVLGAAGLFAVTRQRVIATTADGAVDVLSVEYGTEVEVPVPRSGPLPWLFPTSETQHADQPVLALRIRGNPSRSRVGSRHEVIVGACGCRYSPVHNIEAPLLDVSTIVFRTFPRRQTTLRLECDRSEGRVAEFPSPVEIAAAASPTDVDELPVGSRLDGESWVLTPDHQNPTFIVVRAAGADRSGFDWAFRRAWFTDASGNRVNPKSDGYTTREHRISLPTTAPEPCCASNPDSSVISCSLVA